MNIIEEEEECKFNDVPKSDHEMKVQSFVKPRIADYLNDNHTIENCNVIKRVLHLLSYYQRIKQHENINIYEYLTSLQNYDISTFLEDWHQAKNNHFLRHKDDIEWFKSQIDTTCHPIKICEYVSRHHRQRGKEVYDSIQIKIDYHNMILMDILDSIHAFIFHSSQRQYTSKPVKNIKCKWNDETDEDKHQSEQISINQCTVEQIIFIINNVVFQKLNPKIRDNLISYKPKIISYIKEHECDGTKLEEMKRKCFINDVATYLDNNKLKGSLGPFYKTIMTHFEQKEEKSMVSLDDWIDKPQFIKECSTDQIACIVDHIIANKTNKLREHKQSIINYLKQNQFDGSKLYEIQRKDFINKIAKYLENNKLRAPLGLLRKNIMEFDLSIFTGIQPDEIITSKTTDIQSPSFVPHNNKFETTLTLENNNKTNYFSFGMQYRYTKKLQKHPLYVKSKHNTLKDELIAYFVSVQDTQRDEERLKLSQLETIKSMHSKFHSFLNLLLIGEHASKQQNYADILWIDANVETSSNTRISTLLKTEAKSSQQLQQIITTLCKSFKDELLVSTNFPSILFIMLLKTKLTKFKRLVGNHLKIYFETLADACTIYKSSQNQQLTYCDEHKENIMECTQCKASLQYIQPWTSTSATELMNKDILELLESNIASYIYYSRTNQGDTIGDDDFRLRMEAIQLLMHDVVNIFNHIFQHDDFNAYPLFKSFNTSGQGKKKSKNSDHKFTQENIKSILEDESYINEPRNDESQIFNFYPFVFAKMMENLHQLWLQELCPDTEDEMVVELRAAAEEWFISRTIPKLKSISSQYMHLNAIADGFETIFRDDLYEELPMSVMFKIKNDFATVAMQIIKDKFELNKTQYVDFQSELRSKPFIETALVTIKMSTVKHMKAIWYQGINDAHNVQPNQPIQIEIHHHQIQLPHIIWESLMLLPIQLII
eukprot:547913_1